MALPNELLAAIFHELDPSTLAVAARVSSHFNAVAERRLYSSIHITDILSEQSPHPLKTLRWCEAIRRRAYLFESARKLYIRWQSDRSAPPVQVQHLLDACEQLGAVVQLLVPLESLDLFLGPANLIRGYQEPPIHAIESVIRGCQFTHLRSCSLGAESAKGVQPYTPILTSFLVSPSTLRHLKLSDLHSGLRDLPPDALPHLSSFRGSADAAASILPGRPVRYLSCRTGLGCEPRKPPPHDPHDGASSVFGFISHVNPPDALAQHLDIPSHRGKFTHEAGPPPYTALLNLRHRELPPLYPCISPLAHSRRLMRYRGC